MRRRAVLRKVFLVQDELLAAPSLLDFAQNLGVMLLNGLDNVLDVGLF